MNRMLLTSPRLARSLGNFAGEFENVMDRFLAEAFEEGTQAVETTERAGEPESLGPVASVVNGLGHSGG